MRKLHALQFFEQDMVGEKGYDSAILEVLTRHGAWIVSKSSNANTITHYLSSSAGDLPRAVEELEQRFPGAAVSAQPVSMVAVIGSDISEPGLVPRALKALENASVPMIAMQHQIRNVDVQFIVARDDFERATRALHAALVEETSAARSPRAAA
jgi:aspartate kinase